MAEIFPSESEPVTKEQVIAAYRKFVESGARNPDTLDPTDPEVEAANQLFYKWQSEGDAAHADDPEAALRFNFEKTRIYVEAGFTDPGYLSEVLNWLVQDAADAPQQAENPARGALRHDMAAEIMKIRALLKSA